MSHHHDDTHQDHGCGCSGGCCGGGGGGCCGGGEVVTFSQQEREFLLTLMERQFLPMVQFVVKSSITHEFEMVALSPVYMEQSTATMAEVHQTADMLLRLEELGLLTLDFDIPLDPMSYEVYHQSALYSYLQETVALGKDGPNHLGDTPTIEEGSIAVTALCLSRFSG